MIDKHHSWLIVFGKEKSLDSFQALSDVTLKVPKGKFVGILGRNGAGKSTLLRVLGGVYSPSKGVVRINGEISSLFEMGGLGNNRLTGADYADRYLQLYGVKKKVRQALIKNIQDFSELGVDFNKPIYTYSSGMSARLYFSTATELKYDIYLVDEILSVGDEHFQQKCWKRLRERFSTGASGVLVTHDWPAVLKLCEYSYIMDKGRIVASGCSEKIVQTYLQLPVPTKEYAEIIIDPEGHVYETKKDCKIRFDVLLKKETPIAINYSIEIFRLGFGWELILLHPNDVKIESRLGLNSCVIHINKLPLAPGEYYLNIFVKSLDTHVDALQMDTRSWTYGNGIKIKVCGEPTVAITALSWKLEARINRHATT